MIDFLIKWILHKAFFTFIAIMIVNFVMVPHVRTLAHLAQVLVILTILILLNMPKR